MKLKCDKEFTDTEHDAFLYHTLLPKRNPSVYKNLYSYAYILGENCVVDNKKNVISVIAAA